MTPPVSPPPPAPAPAPASTADQTAPFANVVERSSVDHLFRLMQQHHVQLSMMADTKANIIITVSSIVLTLVLGRVGSPDYRYSMAVLGVFTLVALLLAILAVLPKYQRVSRVEDPLPDTFNIAFFGHFAGMDQARFLRELASRLQPGRTYETIARDVYGLGTYLAVRKYPFLRLSYLFFLAGFLLACLIQAVRVIFY